ncbi:MAG: FtsX-like permease family protein [Streptococcus sp.]|nr:FtsX-like permease family protein [Streptococcus sp.]
MSKKTYWKDIRHSFTSSKGRFLSIFSLMMIGSMTLIGLKITTPNMQKTAQSYIDKTNMADFTILGSYGFSKQDQEELKEQKNATVEFGYLTDVTLENTEDAIRIFSKPTDISTYQLLSGKLPTKDSEIALAQVLAKNYKIGDKISFTEENSNQHTLTRKTFTVTGFVNSADIWNNTNMGYSTAGAGDLTGYAVTTEGAFQSDVYTVARVRYHNLKKLDYYSDAYQQELSKHQKQLEKVFSDNGEKRYEQLSSEIKEKISSGEEQITNSKNQLTQTEEQLNQQETILKASGLPAESPAMQALQEAKTKFAQEKATAETKIKQAETDITKAKETLEELDVPTYSVLTRATIPSGGGYVIYENATSSISAVGNIFPVVLYLVAAMVTFTTMIRFVDEERTNAGILKALGYNDKQIIQKFIFYGLVSSVLGSIVGILIGNFYLSQRIGSIVTANTVIGSSKLYFYPLYTILAIVLGLLSAVLPAYFVAKKELTENPAQLLLAKPPVSGSKILLERVTILWKRLSFTHKVTARNIFRYKQRMLMTILGVAGSVALLFAGLGIRSSIAGIAPKQFEVLFHYDMIVAKKDQVSTSEQKAIDSQLKSSNISDSIGIDYKNISQKIKGVSDKQDISVIITNDKKTFSQFMALQERSTGKKIQLSNDGVVISEKLAQLYQVQVGDSIRLNLNDKATTVKVAKIAEMYIGHFVYMTDNYYHQLTKEHYQTNAYLVSLKNSKTSTIKTVAASFLSSSGVSTAVQNLSLIKQLNIIVNSLQSVMIILIILSILLGIVILYNLTNINVAERIRELSTIKVLGFHNKEVTLYIYRETIVLSIIGIATGLVGGFFLHQFLLSKIGSSNIMFNPSVTAEVYIIPIVAISLILSVLGWFVNHNLRKVDMLEALKSVE